MRQPQGEPASSKSRRPAILVRRIMKRSIAPTPDWPEYEFQHSRLRDRTYPTGCPAVQYRRCQTQEARPQDNQTAKPFVGGERVDLRSCCDLSNNRKLFEVAASGSATLLQDADRPLSTTSRHSLADKQTPKPVRREGPSCCHLTGRAAYPGPVIRS